MITVCMSDYARDFSKYNKTKTSSPHVCANAGPNCPSVWTTVHSVRKRADWRQCAFSCGCSSSISSWIHESKSCTDGAFLRCANIDVLSDSPPERTLSRIQYKCVHGFVCELAYAVADISHPQISYRTRGMGRRFHGVPLKSKLDCITRNSVIIINRGFQTNSVLKLKQR